MVERILERRREPEPVETIYDQMRRLDNDRIKRRGEGKIVIKGSDITWEQNRQEEFLQREDHPDWMGPKTDR